MNRIALRFGLATCLALASLPAATALTPTLCEGEPCPYMDTALPTADRVKDLVGRMTVEEKASQMMNTAVAIPRLGVPAYDWWNEALHGVARRGGATVFPQAIGLAATWDRDLMQRVGETISTEARAIYNQSPNTDKKRYYGLTFWSPNVNIFRDPRWGRGQETYGEDPYLTGRLGTAFVLGVQGDDPKYLKAIATPKHFAVHSGPESTRHKVNVNVSAHDLEDTYLPAFRATFTEGHADSVMCAYNAIDKAPACANTMLLQQHLVADWGFKGYVVSDCDAVADVATGHHFAPDLAAASAVSVKAGTDLDCGDAYKALPEAVKRGLIQESELDAALVRLFTARFKLGMFDPPAMVPFSKIAPSENDSAAHRALALQAARESLVLLKNDGVLPLKTAPHIVAVIGPTAESVDAMQGNYNGTASHPIFARAGLAERFKGSTVLYEPGSVLAEGFTATIPEGALHPEASSQATGLKAEYFDQYDMTGAPALARIDPHVGFDWTQSAPIPGDRFAVRWSGVLQAHIPGEYTINLRGPREIRGNQANKPPSLEERVHIYFDGKLVPPVSENPTRVKVLIGDPGPHALRIEYLHASGDRAINLEWQMPEGAMIGEALRIASAAEVVVAFVGLSPQLEGEEMDVHIPGFEGGDRTDLNLPARQQHLLEALKQTGKPLIVVLNSGSALAVNWAQQNANAILEAWYPGEEGGDALAETIAGDYSPSGRLPVTFYRSVDDLPDFADYSMRDRTYRYYRGEVLYPFGYGLSYAKFNYSAPKVSAKTLHAGEPLTATVQIRNDGAQEADEVVEAYLSAPKTAVSPRLFLAGFQRVHLAAGESRKVSIAIGPREMSEVDADGKRAVVPGDYTLWIGGGQPGTGAAEVTASFKVTGTAALPE